MPILIANFESHISQSISDHNCFLICKLLNKQHKQHGMKFIFICQWTNHTSPFTLTHRTMGILNDVKKSMKHNVHQESVFKASHLTLKHFKILTKQWHTLCTYIKVTVVKPRYADTTFKWSFVYAVSHLGRACIQTHDLEIFSVRKKGLSLALPVYSIHCIDNT